MSSRRVLVIGASSGIGLAASLRQASAGARLTLVARSEFALERAARACHDHGAESVTIHPLDVLDPDALRRSVDSVVSTHGALDAVVHTATVMGYGTVEDMPAETFTAVVDTAVHGTLNVAHCTLPVFRRQGRGTLVVVNSLLGSVTVPNMGAYATAKWGQRALVRTLQQETRDLPDVHVCLLSPGSINTPIYYQAANFMTRSARPPIPVLQPERAGAVIGRLLDRPRNHVSVPVGPGNPVVISGYRLLPMLYDRIVGPLFALAATRGPQARTDGNVHRPNPDAEQLHGRWPEGGLRRRVGPHLRRARIASAPASSRRSGRAVRKRVRRTHD